MKKISIAAAAFTLVFALGCKNQSNTATESSTTAASSSVSSTSQTSLSPEELGALGAKIKKTPDDAQRFCRRRD